MPHAPDFAQFSKLAADHDMVPVFRRLISDSLTPVSAFHKLDDSGPACLFESVIGGEKIGRYSFLGFQPDYHLAATRTDVTVTTGGKSEEFSCENPLEELRRRLADVRVAHLDGLPPFTGGAIGYAGYDVIRYVEDLPNAPEDDRGLPDLSFGFYHRLVVFDNVAKTVDVIVLAKCDAKDAAGLKRTFDTACGEVDEIVAKLTAFDAQLVPTDIDTGGPVTLKYESNFTQNGFEDAVRSCVEYIKAGDIFQVVVSQRLQTDITCDPFEIYRTLRIVNPSPFMFFLRTAETTLVGSSPEIMVRVVDGHVTVRPLAGTRPRGRNEDEDNALAEELLADPKERAEHVMLVDLGRNDVGRVAQYRSVEVSDVMVIERYSHVMHITSNVTGQLRDDCDAFDALAACLPAGTVSGAPKVRAMEIIDELETRRRGPYAGAVGYVDYSGNMDTCIALRTIVIQGNTAYVQAGAGLVADSVPSSEFQETLNKARGLLKAIEITERRAGK
ncbi:anthranilate synthase component I [Blastopirellula retiformator]|uniref:Anthranilate synthase component 1 n=1 Tax=Blastopirellula retiformator TaxID=2527970 RepID=A0A5C5VPP4_9BACT|nr:anthranilate synthase component I [Blastopirellula retiformator]TWT39592.1 Anthranilate synthase component 1 [Blastopirellula retiformator]